MVALAANGEVDRFVERYRALRFWNRDPLVRPDLIGGVTVPDGSLRSALAIAAPQLPRRVGLQVGEPFRHRRHDPL